MIPNYPKIMPLPMAQNGNKNDIPLTSEDAGAFTYNEGFPSITQVPVNAGGKAPKRTDFNGVLNELSQHIFFLQNGGQYQWSAELDYNIGAVIQGSDGNPYQALRVSGPNSGGAKNPVSAGNTAYWKKTALDLVQTIRDSKTASTAQAPSEKAVALELENIDTLLGNSVDKTSNQDIDGIKNFKPMKLRVKSPNIEAFKTPSTDISESILFVDKNGVTIGSVNIAYLKNGKKQIGLILHKNSNTLSTLILGVDASGNSYTYAPTPPNNDNSTQIATTAWVNTNNNNGKVTGKGFYHDIGVWTITNLTPNKPLFIINKQDQGEGYSDIKIISGVEPTMLSSQTYRMGKDGSNVFVCIPVEETVQIQIVARSNYNVCRAYQ